MKKGVTISVLAVTVIIMFIIVSATAVIGFNSVSTANYEDFCSKLRRTKDSIDLYKYRNNTYPTDGATILISELDNSMKAELVAKGDQYDTLLIITMEDLDVVNVHLGIGTVSNKDLFLVAQTSGNLYYLRGFNYKGQTYHSLEN